MRLQYQANPLDSSAASFPLLRANRSKPFMDRKPKAEQPGAGENSAASVGTQIVSLFVAAMLQWATVLIICPSLHELIRELVRDRTRVQEGAHPPAEDNFINQKVAAGQLRRLRYRSDSAANGREVLEALQVDR
jgi:hypothetical protein